MATMREGPAWAALGALVCLMMAERTAAQACPNAPEGYTKFGGNCIDSNSKQPDTYACASETFNVTTCMAACEGDDGCTAYQSTTYAPTPCTVVANAGIPSVNCPDNDWEFNKGTGTTDVDNGDNTAGVCCYKRDAGPARPQKQKVKNSLSGGTVLLLIFFFGALGPYLGLGYIYNWTVAHKEGHIQRIPNLGFWQETFACTKDGFRFAFAKARQQEFTPSLYEAI